MHKNFPSWVAVGLLLATVGLFMGCLHWTSRSPGREYRFITAWGHPGTGPGEFNDPTGIAANSTEVFVSDSRNSRIQVFDHEGRFKRQFDIPMDETGRRGRPMNLDLHEGNLYVADYWSDRIHVFTLEGRLVRSLGRKGQGPGEFDSPGGVAVAPNGELFVADFYNQRIQRLSPEGAFLGQWGVTRKTGVGAGLFNYPTDVAVAPDGTLYVADGYNDRIQVFSSTGQFITKWGGPFALNISGPFKGWFATVTSVALNASGHVFASDFYNDRVQWFDRAGNYLGTLGEKGSGPGQLVHPMGVAVSPNGAVFITDFGNQRVQKWQEVGGQEAPDSNSQKFSR